MIYRTETGFFFHQSRLDLFAVGRISLVGGTCMAPVLHAWYNFLDARMPGTAWKIVAKKLFLDSTVLSIPVYSAFFIGRL